MPHSLPVGTDGKSTLVDAEDFLKFRELKLYLWGRGYAFYRTPEGMRPFHRLLLGLDDLSVQVDHINRDRLDNRRSNLRTATIAQNAQNRGPKPGAASQYRGVCWNKKSNKWQAYVKLEGRSYHLGLFSCEHEAARAASEFRAAHMPYSADALRRAA